ncbi:DUF3006 family protein [Candidatus Falkowbacteria bacterium]|nr:DUF3006 family protein [Candidatus Falkowbacteria bacterium]
MKVILTIDRLEGDKAVLKDNGEHTIVWPRQKMPEEFKEGDSVVFDIGSNPEGEKADRNQAKDILNEILDI